MRYRIDYKKNRLSGCIKASLAGLFILLSLFPAISQDYWTPKTDAFDNYMTITGYIMLNGVELQSDQIEIGCFIDNECRGNYHLQPMEYMGHPYSCFLAVWGSASDNGKTITVKVYDHESKTILEAVQKPEYIYNGDLGTNDPYEFTLSTVTTGMVNISATTNGTVSASPANPVAENATVTLTISPGAGYELDAISVHKTGDETVTINLSGTGITRTFTMPTHDVTVNATFKKTADQLAIEAAKALIEAISNLTVAQATANTEASVKAWLVQQINNLEGMSATGITISVANITFGGFSAAIAGTSGSPSGTNGSFDFTVTIIRGESSLITGEISGTIIAAPFVAVKSIELFLLDSLTVRIVNTGNLPTGDLTLTLSGDDADAFILPAVTVNSLPVNSETEVVIEQRAGLADGEYTAILTVSATDLPPVQVEISIKVISTGIKDFLPANKLKAWIQNGRLNIDGLTVSKPWRVYDLCGRSVHHGIAGRDKAEISLPVHGMYIILSGKEAIKITY